MCAQLYKILCDPMDHSLPGYSVLGILQARILEWVAISYSRGSSRPRDLTWISCIVIRFLTAESPGKPTLMRASCDPFIHLFKKYLLSSNYMPEMILGCEEMKVNKKTKSLPPGKGAVLGALLQKF